MHRKHVGAVVGGAAIAGRLYEHYGFVSNLTMGVASVLLGLALYALVLLAGRRMGMFNMHEARRPSELLRDVDDGRVSLALPRGD